MEDLSYSTKSGGADNTANQPVETKFSGAPSESIEEFENNKKIAALKEVASRFATWALANHIAYSFERSRIDPVYANLFKNEAGETWFKEQVHGWEIYHHWLATDSASPDEDAEYVLFGIMSDGQLFTLTNKFNGLLVYPATDEMLSMLSVADIFSKIGVYCVDYGLSWDDTNN